MSEICLFKLGIYDQTMSFASSSGHKSSVIDSMKATYILNLDTSVLGIIFISMRLY